MLRRQNASELYKYDVTGDKVYVPIHDLQKVYLK